jgi:Protein of unknown function (DUF732)
MCKYRLHWNGDAVAEGNVAMSPKRRMTEDSQNEDMYPFHTELSEVAHGDTERVLAWGDAGAEIPHLSGDGEVDDDRRPLPMALVILLAGVVVCGIGLGAYVVGWGQTRVIHETTTVLPTQIGPFPVPSNLPTAVTKETVQAAPPVQVPVQPPEAHQQFTEALRGDKPQTQDGNGLYPIQPRATIDSEAQAMCRDLANGGAIQPYIDGTLRKSPTLAPWQAARVVHQAIQAYCPQYDK